MGTKTLGDCDVLDSLPLSIPEKLKLPRPYFIPEKGENRQRPTVHACTRSYPNPDRRIAR